jgi:hypothetical protein
MIPSVLIPASIEQINEITFMFYIILPSLFPSNEIYLSNAHIYLISIIVDLDLSAIITNNLES